MGEVASQPNDPAGAVVRRLLAGDAPNGILAEACGTYSEVIAALYGAYAVGGTTAVRKAFDALVRSSPELAVLVAGNAPSGKRYELYWLGDAMQPQQPLQWVIENLFAEASLSIVVGDPGSGKTWLLLDAAMAVATGADWLGRRTIQGPVLIVDEESGRRRLERRIAAIARARHAPLDTPLAYVSLTQFDFRSPEDLQALHELIVETEATFVGIDAMADIMPGGDENAVKDVQPLLMGLRKVVEETGAAVALLHHANRAGGYRGSSAIPGAVDLMLKVESKPDRPIIDISSEKTRDVEPFRMAAHIRFEEEPLFKVFVTPAERSEQAQADPPKLTAGEEYVLRYLRQYGASKIQEIRDHADTCTSVTAYKAVFKLAQKRIIDRVDDRGPGAEATYDLIRTTPEGQPLPYRDD